MDGDEVAEEEIAVQRHAIKGKKWTIVAVLLTVNLLNYMDRFTIAGVLSQLQQYFRINDEDAGMLQTVFIVFYMVCAPVCGVMGDRYNRKLIMSVGLAVWICAVLASSFVGAEHFGLFMLLRGLVGVGEASYSTVAPTLIADSFGGPERSTVLMIFYFAVPVGSGLGYIGGSTLSLFFGGWQWGVRLTPVLGVVCLLLLVFLLEEPARGGAEGGGADEVAELEKTSVMDDLKYLASIPTYRLTTAGFTCVVFAVGSLSWWTPSLIEYSYAIRHGTSRVPDSEKASVALIFGLVTCAAGICGVLIGSTVAQAWREGRHGIRASHRADAMVCAFGSLSAIPLLFTCLLVAGYSITIAWGLMFLGVTCMCLNWAINMDMLMYTVVANRRATATAIQTLISHLLGDATSPFIIGMLSDAIRDGDRSVYGHFFALQSSLFLPNFVLVGSVAFYLWASFHVVEDQRRAKHDMHVASAWDEGDDVETLVSNVRRDSGDSA